jgi:drug/metabolite transporter (DMT)-like permease
MSGLWFPLTIVCALAVATSDALTKHAFRRHDEYLVMWLRLVLTLPVFLAIRFTVPQPEIRSGFYSAGFTALPLEILAIILYLNALKLSPLGLTLPFMALTPVFLLVIPYLLLGETITTAGGIGILLIAVGSYCLNLGKAREGLLAPLKAVLREKGSLCMIGVAFLYSITSTLGKKGIEASSPLYFASWYFPLLVAGLAPVALWKGRAELRSLQWRPLLKSALLPGLFSSIEIVTYVVAVSLTKVAYAIAVKRLSLLAGVIYGRLLFGEPGFREKILGGALMVAGVAVIVIAGK